MHGTWVCRGAACKRSELSGTTILKLKKILIFPSRSKQVEEARQKAIEAYKLEHPDVDEA